MPAACDSMPHPPPRRWNAIVMHAICTTAVQREWEKDSAGNETMDFQQFFNSVYEALGALVAMPSG